MAKKTTKKTTTVTNVSSLRAGERREDLKTDWQAVQNEIAKSLAGVRDVVNPNVPVPTLTQLSGGLVQGAGTFGGVVPGTTPVMTESQMEAAAEAARLRTSAFDLARNLSSQWGIGPELADAVIEMVSQKGYTSSAVLLSIRDTQQYKDRFAGLENYKKKYASEIEAGKKALPPTEEEYIALEQDYQTTLTRYGLGDLANRSTYSQLIGNDVSLAEVQDRIEKVYDKINNADELLKTQLRTYFPTLGTSDFAKALLTGTSPEDMAAQLQRKIRRAEIGSEMTRFGLQGSQAIETELETLGITRDVARAGFGKVAEALTPVQKLAQIYEGTAAGVQEELTAEQFKGLQSQRRKKLEESERAAFAGSAGISTVSLGTSTTGSF